MENTQTQKRFCTECGAELAANVKFCTECGALVKSGAPEPETPKSGGANQIPELVLVTSAPEDKTAKVSPADKLSPTEKLYPQEKISSPEKIYVPPAAPGNTYNTGAGNPRGMEIPGKTSPYQPVSALGYIGIYLLAGIPLIGLILTIVWAAGGCRKINKRNWARSILIIEFASVILAAVTIGVLYATNFFGYSVPGDVFGNLGNFFSGLV